jgi:hypothetical protein
MPRAIITPESVLIVARVGGSSSSRRQRRFPSVEAGERAITRWAKEGYDVFWTRQGDAELSKPFRLDDDGQRVTIG